MTPGQHIRIETGDGVVTGYAEDVEPSGALRVRGAAGEVRVIASGDVLAGGVQPAS